MDTIVPMALWRVFACSGLFHLALATSSVALWMSILGPVERAPLWFGVLALAGLTVFAWMLAYSSYLLTMESHDMGSTVPQSIIDMQLYIPQAVSTFGFIVFAITALVSTLVAAGNPEPIAEEGGI